MAEHAVDELRGLIARVRLGELDRLIDDDRHRRVLRVQQLECAEPQHGALHLAEVDKRPVLHTGDDGRVDRVEMIDAAHHDGACERDDISRGAQVAPLVAQCELRVLRGPLDLEQHPERKLPSAPPPSRARRSRGHAKATSLTKTLTSSTRSASMRSMASATRCCTSAPTAGTLPPDSMTTYRLRRSASSIISTRTPRWACERRTMRSKFWPLG